SQPMRIASIHKAQMVKKKPRVVLVVLWAEEAVHKTHLMQPQRTRNPRKALKMVLVRVCSIDSAVNQNRVTDPKHKPAVPVAVLSPRTAIPLRQKHKQKPARVDDSGVWRVACPLVEAMVMRTAKHLLKPPNQQTPHNKLRHL